MRRFLLAIFIVLGGGAFSGALANEYTLCNKTSYAINAAIAHEENARLVTRGWWRLRPGGCQIVLTEARPGEEYFVYGESIIGHQGELRVWEGDQLLCVGENEFVLRDQTACKDAPRQRRPFFSVTVNAETEKGWRTEFSEPQLFTAHDARIAGVQRLLNDIGYEIGRIDGSMGARTTNAIREFSDEKSLGNTAAKIDDRLIDALIKEANAKSEDKGFRLCNDADGAVWGAIAAPVAEDGFTSQGWWRMTPGECVKVLKGDLASNEYYVYGVLEGAESDIPMNGGDREFCTNSVLFEIEGDMECESEGFDIAPFKRVRINEALAWTHRFTADDFTN